MNFSWERNLVHSSVIFFSDAVPELEKEELTLKFFKFQSISTVSIDVARDSIKLFTAAIS